MDDSFPTPCRQQQFSLEIKASRFLTTVAKVSDREAGKEFIRTISSHYADANHNCWAMVAGQPGDALSQDQSDDGEPKGTAGKPMLNALQHSGLGNVAVVVTRYFGGVKLGAGGLVRAYTRCVTDALSQIETETCHICISASVVLPYPELDEFLYWLQSTRITVADKSFTDNVCVDIEVPLGDQSLLNEFSEGRKNINVHWLS